MPRVLLAPDVASLRSRIRAFALASPPARRFIRALTGHCGKYMKINVNLLLTALRSDGGNRAMDQVSDVLVGHTAAVEGKFASCCKRKGLHFCGSIDKISSSISFSREITL